MGKNDKPTADEIRAMFDRGLTVEMVIDQVIQANGIIGVGLVTLGDTLKDYCYKHDGYKPEPKFKYYAQVFHRNAPRKNPVNVVVYSDEAIDDDDLFDMLQDAREDAGRSVIFQPEKGDEVPFKDADKVINCSKFEIN